MSGKSIQKSNYNAKYSGILPRVNMPHSQYLIKSLDFTQLLLCSKQHQLTILPLDSADCTVGPHFF